MLIQITGLPRSATAFLSSFLSLHPDCIAYHELVNYEDDYRSKLAESLKKYQFVVDCSTYGYLPQCVYHDSKKLLIKRDMYESLRRSELAMGAVIAIERYEELCDLIEEWVDAYNPLVINYGRLFMPSTLLEVWEYVFGSDDYFSREKAELFCRLNIQMNRPEQVLNDKSTHRIVSQIS